MNCPRIAIAEPMMTAARMPGSIRAFHSEFLASVASAFIALPVSSICLWTSALSLYIFWRVSAAWFVFPLTISHLGLSGTIRITSRKSRSGMSSQPSIPLQYSEPKYLPVHVALSAAGPSAYPRIMKLTRYATRNPIVTASWYIDTNVPRFSAGATSDI